jgi:hypothetical protein
MPAFRHKRVDFNHIACTRVKPDKTGYDQIVVTGMKIMLAVVIAVIALP